jgi:Ankyrin repeats (3 copies)
MASFSAERYPIAPQSKESIFLRDLVSYLNGLARNPGVSEDPQSLRKMLMGAVLESPLPYEVAAAVRRYYIRSLVKASLQWSDLLLGDDFLKEIKASEKIDDPWTEERLAQWVGYSRALVESRIRHPGPLSPDERLRGDREALVWGNPLWHWRVLHFFRLRKDPKEILDPERTIREFNDYWKQREDESPLVFPHSPSKSKVPAPVQPLAPVPEAKKAKPSAPELKKGKPNDLETTLFSDVPVLPDTKAERPIEIPNEPKHGKEGGGWSFAINQIIGKIQGKVHTVGGGVKKALFGSPFGSEEEPVTHEMTEEEAPPRGKGGKASVKSLAHFEPAEVELLFTKSTQPQAPSTLPIARDPEFVEGRQWLENGKASEAELFFVRLLKRDIRNREAFQAVLDLYRDNDLADRGAELVLECLSDAPGESWKWVGEYFLNAKDTLENLCRAWNCFSQANNIDSGLFGSETLSELERQLVEKAGEEGRALATQFFGPKRYAFRVPAPRSSGERKGADKKGPEAKPETSPAKEIPPVAQEKEPVLEASAEEPSLRSLMEEHGILLGSDPIDPIEVAFALPDPDDAVAMGILLDHGLEPNAGKDGETLLIHAAARGAIGVIVVLLRHGANPNLAGSDGWAPLMPAVSLSSVEVAKALVNGGAIVDRPGPNSRTALMVSSELGKAKIVEFLIQNGADVNAADQFRKTALMGAAEWGHTETVKVLMKAGARVDMRDDQGLTAWDYAERQKRAELLQVLPSSKKEPGKPLEKKVEVSEIAPQTFRVVEGVQGLVGTRPTESRTVDHPWMSEPGESLPKPSSEKTDPMFELLPKADRGSGVPAQSRGKGAENGKASEKGVLPIERTPNWREVNRIYSILAGASSLAGRSRADQDSGRKEVVDAIQKYVALMAQYPQEDMKCREIIPLLRELLQEGLIIEQDLLLVHEMDVQRNPKSYESVADQGRTLFEIGTPDSLAKAKKLFEQALKMNPKPSAKFAFVNECLAEIPQRIAKKSIGADVGWSVSDSHSETQVPSLEAKPPLKPQKTPKPGGLPNKPSKR